MRPSVGRSGGSSSSSRSHVGAPGPMPVVPMIPGLVPNHRQFLGRTDFRKPQVLEQMAQGKLHEPRATAPTLSSNGPAPPPPPVVNIAANAAATTAKPKSVPSATFRVDSSQPAWITHDRQVLRFFGYFREPTTDGRGDTTQRLRRVTLLYYLSDGSVAVSEPRVPNSGLAQGEFLRRTVIEGLTPAALRVGKSVRLFGRSFGLVDCDAATRQYYDEALGAPQDPAIRYPDERGGSEIDEVDALKRRLAAHAAARAESKAGAVRKFHAHPTDVLRFFVSWRDPHPLYPETRRYALHYYLADDTIEIVEPKTEREGRGHFAVLLTRRKLRREPQQTTTATTTTTATEGPFISDRDLRCGEFVQIHARRFLLEDCDAFTRDYYLERHGVTQERVETTPTMTTPSARALVDPRPAKWRLFDATKDPGNASPSSLSHHLDGRRPRDERQSPQDVEQAGNKQLRFRARFHRPPRGSGPKGRRPGADDDDPDAAREFVVTFYLEDDTLAVFEPRVPNSGIVGGRFLDRGRFRKCHPGPDQATPSREQGKTPSLYRASDFFVGAVIAFEFAPHQRLELLEADRQTLRLCESRPELFPFADIHRVLQVLVRALRPRGRDPRREARALDPRGHGTLGVADVRVLLERLGVEPGVTLNAHQMITLFRRFELEPSPPANGPEAGPRDPRRFAYEDFCDELALAMQPPPPPQPPMATTTTTTTTVAKSALDKLKKCTGLRRLLRELAAASSTTSSNRNAMPTTVALEDLARVAREFHATLTPADLDEIAASFGTQQRGRQRVIRFHALCDRVFHIPGTPPPNDAPAKGGNDDDHDDNDNGGHGQDDDRSSLRAPSDDLGDFGGDDGGDACERVSDDDDDDNNNDDDDDDVAGFRSRPPSPHRARVPPLPLPKAHGMGREGPPFPFAPRGAGATSAAAVAGLLNRLFGSRKYQLRRAFRAKDRDKSGRLREEEFMDALLAVEPTLSDEDAYRIAEVYFASNNGLVDYVELLDNAFRAAS